MSNAKNKISLDIDHLVFDALAILQAFGIPVSDQTQRRQQRMAKAFLAVADVRPGHTWQQARGQSDGHLLLSREIIRFMNEHLGESIADSSYDDIRRKDLILPVTAGIVLKSAVNPNAATNDGTRAYALDDTVTHQLRLYGQPDWAATLPDFLRTRTKLSQILQRQRQLSRIPVMLPDGKPLELSAGGHNTLQKQIIEDFLPLFGFGAQVLYVGDTAKKLLHMDIAGLSALGLPALAHDQLPDVVAYSASKNWLYLIEAVHSANPITELRRHALEDMTKDCPAGKVYVTAFPNRATFRTHSKDVAWETEVWIADAPDHLIHFNGDKFLGPHASERHTTTP